MYIITTFIVMITAFIVFIYSDANHLCRKYEEESLCTNVCSEETCIPPKEPKICPLYCLKGCKCQKGFVRIMSNTTQCIPKGLCPFLAPFIDEQTSCYPCGKYSRYTTCGGSCPETCNPSDYETVRCSSTKNLKGCVCDPGFVKISKDINICIPKFLCPIVQPFVST